MRELVNYSIWAKEHQYQDVMGLLYDLEVFPFDDDPIDKKDYIDNFRFMCSQEGEFLRFLLIFTKEADVSELEEKLMELATYDASGNYPRVTRDD